MISIIVPVYNVETYLRECIDSILRQTYRDIEVILVDDGSTDASGDLCDEYALKDSRVRAVHKQNGGLSSARNAGIAVAKGDYIGFVDSDDYIAPDMFEKLISQMSDNRIGVTSCGMELVKDSESVSLQNVKNDNVAEHTVISHDKIFEVFVDSLSVLPLLNVVVKLYRSDLFENLRFIVGRNCEDVYFMYHLSKVLAEKKLDMLLLPDNLYYYRIRENSITQSKKKPHNIDLIKNLKEIIDDYPDKLSDAYWKLVHKYIWHVNYCLNLLSSDVELYNRYFPEIRPYLIKTSARDFATGYSGVAKYKVMVHTLLQKLRWCFGIF